MNDIDKQYLNLLQDILDNGVVKKDRTGTGTISVFGREIRHKMLEGFPALTTKKLAFKSVVTELKWFLKGDTNIQYLVQNGCNVWNGDCYKKYCKIIKKELDLNDSLITHPDYNLSKLDFIDKIKNDNIFAEKYGDLGRIYGAQWRNWGGIDQIENMIKTLKTNPDSRRIMVNSWNVTEIESVVLPPCHFSFQFYTRPLSDEERYNIWFSNNYKTDVERYFNPEKLPDFDNEYYTPTPIKAISLKWVQRSADVPLGIPFNIASYALLLEMVAKEVGMIPDELIGSLGDTHIYLNQIDGVKEQLTKKPLPLPKLKINSSSVLDGEVECELINYKHQGIIKFPLSN